MRDVLLRLLLAGGLIGAAAAQPAPDAAASAAAEPPASAASDTKADTEAEGVAWRLNIEAPGALRDLLDRHLDLARYLRQEEGTARVTRTELSRLVAAAPAQARSLLETEGYFSSEVEAALDQAAQPVTVTLRITPGPLARVAGVQLEFAGALSAAEERGDAGARALIERLRREFGLRAGEPYTQAAWSGAKSGLLARLRAEGFALASFGGTQADVDAPQARATLFLVADSGPLLRVGETRVRGLNHVKPEAVTALQLFPAGVPMREQTLQEFQDRLVKANLFDAVSVSPSTELLDNPSRIDMTAAELTVPLQVRLRERSPQQATVGVGVSDTTGPRITLEHQALDPLGLGWSARSKLQLGQTQRAVSVDLISQPVPGPYRNLVSGAVRRTEASGLIVLSQNLRVGRTHDTQNIERLSYLQYERDITRAESSGVTTDDTSALTLNYHWILRRLDNPLLPTRGYGLAVETGAGRSFHTDTDSGFFARALGRLTGYWPLGERFYGQARLQAGQVFAADNTSVPYTQLFRAGGDDSVRGYGNQTLGPVDAAGNAVGGRVLGAGSLEIARPISRKYPDFWLAGFVDAGNAAPSWSQLSPALGYGVGLRWRSPVGPLRIDLAYGEKVHRARLHFTVGVTF